jgi:Mg2+ and Co2+ transporter CorA
VAKVPKIHDDTLSRLLDRIGVLREELVSIERSLERMKDAESKKAKRPS